MEKKKNGAVKRGVVRIIQNILLAVLLCTVLALTASVIALLALNAAFEGDTVFDMEQFSSVDAEDDAVIEEHLLPSFIGIRAKGEQKGISAGYNTVRALYELLSPVLCDVLNGSFKQIAQDRFTSALSSSTLIYMKYHFPLPWQAVYVCAGGTEEVYGQSLSLSELLILPEQGFCILARTADGTVYLFEGTYKSYFTVETLDLLMRSYQRNMTDFVFTQEGMGEPQFTERIRTKNMLVTENTAALIQNRESHIAAILRLMNFNPDKLYTHEESDSGVVYVETHGVLRLLDDSVDYTAGSADGGIPVDRYLTRHGSEGYTLQDYLATACLIVESIRELSPHYVGGDADILLESVCTKEDGSLTLRFLYTFDNLRLSGCEPALVIGFKNGKMTDFRLFSVSARNLGVQEDSFLEEWYYETALSRCPEGWRIVDVCPVYQTDFYADSISAEWAAVYGKKREEDVKTDLIHPSH